MKLFIALIVTFLALGTTGCMSDQTKNMAETCQDLLDQGNLSDVRTFIQDAQEQLASLDKPGNRVTTYLRDLQDPEAMTYKPALQQCLWLLKSRQT